MHLGAFYFRESRYCLEDESSDTQWVKVNKSFLGDGNNFEYAAINDSTEYNTVTVTVEENGGANRLWTLSEKYVAVDNSSGIFQSIRLVNNI